MVSPMRVERPAALAGTAGSRSRTMARAAAATVAGARGVRITAKADRRKEGRWRQETNISGWRPSGRRQSRASATTPMTSANSPPPGDWVSQACMTRLPMAISSPQTVRANDSLTTTTSGEPAPSRASKSRPRRSGMRSTSK